MLIPNTAMRRSSIDTEANRPIVTRQYYRNGNDDRREHHVILLLVMLYAVHRVPQYPTIREVWVFYKAAVPNLFSCEDHLFFKRTLRPTN